MRLRILALSFCAIAASAMTDSDEIRIISPKNGTIVAPGAILQVTVEAKPFLFHAVMLAGRPTGFNNVLSTPPYRFTVRIDPDAQAGPEDLTALGDKSEGEAALSAPLTIDIERPDSPDRLETNLSRLFFDGVGDDGGLDVKAHFPDGGILHVNRSTYIRFRSESPAVATVDDSGHVAAKGVGSTRIVIQYRNKSIAVPVTVPANAKAKQN